MKHYAGDVIYNINGFIEKNRDTLFQDFKRLLFNSKNPVLIKIIMMLLLMVMVPLMMMVLMMLLLMVMVPLMVMVLMMLLLMVMVPLMMILPLMVMVTMLSWTRCSEACGQRGRSTSRKQQRGRSPPEPSSRTPCSPS